MKFLIWTVCVVIAAMIMVLLDNLGLFTGALWKTLIFAAMCTTATILCKKLDKKRDKKRIPLMSIPRELAADKQ